MVYKQKHIDPPMSLLGKRLRQGGRYAYSYFDMDEYNSTVFSIFTAPGAEIFSRLTTGWILCTTRKTITGILSYAEPDFQHAHDSYHRFFPDCRWDINKLWQILASDAGQVFLSDRHHHHCSGRHAVPPQRQKDQWCCLLAGCGPFDQEEHRLCLGTESGGSDIADSATLGRLIIGVAYQYEIASKKRRYSYRTGDADDQSTPSMAAGKAISAGCRRFLCYLGRKANASNIPGFENTVQRKDFRSASKKKKEDQRQTSQERQTPCQSTKDDFVYSRLGADRVLAARQKGKAIGLYPSGHMVLGFALADTACDKQRPRRQRTRRFSFYDGFDDDREKLEFSRQT